MIFTLTALSSEQEPRPPAADRNMQTRFCIPGRGHQFPSQPEQHCVLRHQGQGFWHGDSSGSAFGICHGGLKEKRTGHPMLISDGFLVIFRGKKMRRDVSEKEFYEFESYKFL